MKTEWAIIKRLVTEYRAATDEPEIARMCILIRSSWSSIELQTIVREIVFADGDMQRVFSSLRNMPVGSVPWAGKFSRWCEKVLGEYQKGGAA